MKERSSLEGIFPPALPSSVIFHPSNELEGSENN
jgi:hypothetical protein